MGIHSRSSDEAKHDLGNKNKMDIVGRWVEVFFAVPKLHPPKLTHQSSLQFIDDLDHDINQYEDSLSVRN